MPVFTFTRHAPSCNNITNNPLAKVAEPAIIDKGIKDAILVGKSLPWLVPAVELRRNKLDIVSLDEEEARFPSFSQEGSDEVVFVSPLLRTWMTAACIMSKSKRLTLNVSKFLKEYDLGWSFDSGNLPAEFNVQVEKFLFFLNYIQTARFQLEEITVWLDEPSIRSSLAVFKVKNVVEWYVDSANSTFKYPDEYKKYYPEGIQEFIKSKLSSPRDVHAVAHNELMEHCLTNLKRPKPPEKENLWSIVVSADSNDETTWNVWRISGIALELIDSDPNLLCTRSNGGKRSYKKRRVSRVSKRRRSRFSRGRR
jgi:hypothetical protein